MITFEQIQTFKKDIVETIGATIDDPTWEYRLSITDEYGGLTTIQVEAISKNENDWPETGPFTPSPNNEHNLQWKFPDASVAIEGFEILIMNWKWSDSESGGSATE